MKYYGKMVFIEFLVFGCLMTIYILILNLYLLLLFYCVFFFLDDEEHLSSFYFFTGESHVTLWYHLTGYKAEAGVEVLDSCASFPLCRDYWIEPSQCS